MKDENLLVPLYIVSMCAGTGVGLLVDAPFRLGITTLGVVLPLGMMAAVWERYANESLDGALSAILGFPLFSGIPFGVAVLLAAAGATFHLFIGLLLGLLSFFGGVGVALGVLSVPTLAEYVRLRA